MSGHGGLRATLAAGAHWAGPVLVAYAGLEDARSYHTRDPRGAEYFLPLLLVTLTSLATAATYSWPGRARSSAEHVWRVARTVTAGAPIGVLALAFARAFVPRSREPSFDLPELVGFGLGAGGVLLLTLGIALAPQAPPAPIEDEIEPADPGFFEELERRQALAASRASGEEPDEDEPTYELVASAPPPTDAELARAESELRARPFPLRVALALAFGAAAHAAVLVSSARAHQDPAVRETEARDFVAAVIWRIDQIAEAEEAEEAERTDWHERRSGSFAYRHGQGRDGPRRMYDGDWMTTEEHDRLLYEVGAWSCNDANPWSNGPTGPGCAYARSMDRLDGIGGPHDATLAAFLRARADAPSVDAHPPTVELVRLTGPLEPSDVLRRFRARGPAFRLCSEHWRLAMPLPAKLELRFLVDRANRVTMLYRRGGDASVPLGNCVVEAAHGIRFDDLAPLPRLTSVEILLRFSSPDTPAQH